LIDLSPIPFPSKLPNGVDEVDMLVRIAKTRISNFFLRGAYLRERYLFYNLDTDDIEQIGKTIFSLPKIKYSLSD